jgi:hypothetical protein
MDLEAARKTLEGYLAEWEVEHRPMLLPVDSIRAVLSSLEEQRAENAKLRAVCKGLWVNRDASTQAQCRVLYNAWKDLGDIIGPICSLEDYEKGGAS